MALALRAGAPILVAEEVMDKAGVEEASLKPHGAAEA
jgi:bifunctional DNase/RNase